MSIVQDLVTVVLVVPCRRSAAARTRAIGGLILRAPSPSGFVAVLIVAGSRVLPRLLALIARLGSRELFIIAVAVVAIGTACAATRLE